MRRQAKSAIKPFEKYTVSELLRRYPKTLEVFDKHGVHFCAGCHITLTSDVRKAAGYHAVQNFKIFLLDLQKAIKWR